MNCLPRAYGRRDTDPVAPPEDSHPVTLFCSEHKKLTKWILFERLLDDRAQGVEALSHVGRSDADPNLRPCAQPNQGVALDTTQSHR